MSTLTTPTAPQPKQLQGNCHCGRFRFLLPANLDLKNPFTCACTLCPKLGCLWLRGVTADSFTVTRNGGSLVEYQGLKFCGNCGTAVTGEHQSGALKGRFWLMPGRFGGLILLGLILSMNLFECGCVIWMELLTTEISRQVHRKCSRAG